MYENALVDNVYYFVMLLIHLHLVYLADAFVSLPWSTNCGQQPDAVDRVCRLRPQQTSVTSPGRKRARARRYPPRAASVSRGSCFTSRKGRGAVEIVRVTFDPIRT